MPETKVAQPEVVVPADRLALGTDAPRVDLASTSHNGFCDAMLGLCMAED